MRCGGSLALKIPKSPAKKKKSHHGARRESTSRSVPTPFLRPGSKLVTVKIALERQGRIRIGRQGINIVDLEAFRVRRDLRLGAEPHGAVVLRKAAPPRISVRAIAPDGS